MVLKDAWAASSNDASWWNCVVQCSCGDGLCLSPRRLCYGCASVFLKLAEVEWFKFDRSRVELCERFREGGGLTVQSRSIVLARLRLIGTCNVIPGSIPSHLSSSRKPAQNLATPRSWRIKPELWATNRPQTNRLANGQKPRAHHASNKASLS